MDSKKLIYLERPSIMGQSNYSPYRPLALFYPVYKLAEMIFEIQFLLKENRYKLPFPASLPRQVYNFQELENFFLKYLPKDSLKTKIAHYFSSELSSKISALRYGYVFFDIYNRNKKFNKEKTNSYKYLYSLDLALWHSMATFVFPIYAANASFAVFRNFALFPKNRNFYWNFVSVFAAIYAFVHLVKFGDFTADLAMNNTFRRFVYDYKNEEVNQFTVEYDKLKQLDNAGF